MKKNLYLKYDSNEQYDKLIYDISKVVNNGRNEAAKAINNVLVNTYWQIGRYIVEYEQGGNSKAEYGLALLKNLASDLTIRLGKGFSRPNLNNMRLFYLRYPICQTVSDKLSWSHICELIKIDDELERSFYEKETINEKWDVRTLRRQKNSSLYLRLAASKDKEGLLKLANNGIEIQKPEDIIKDTYTLEFLKIPQAERYSEKELEDRIIGNLEKFLLELARRFTGIFEIN